MGRQLPYEVVGRRAGDVVDLTANPTRANTELKWKAELSIEDSCRDLWRWTTENPFGFQNDSYKWSLFQAKNDTSYLSRLHTVKFSETDFEVSIANYGALIQDIKKKGQSFVQGFSSLDGYKHPDNPFFWH